jgi:hypothetical protein
MATLSLKTDKTPTQLWSERVVYDRIPASEIERSTALSYLIDNDGWTLDEYVEWINRDSSVFALMGADKWRERGIHTASELGRLLDAEHERNMRKEAMYDY